MMKRRSDLKADIDKIKKLQALQQKATDKLDKIGDASTRGAASAAKSPLKKTAAPKKPAVKKKAAAPVKKKAKAPAKKKSFWQKLFGKKSRSQQRSKAQEVGFKS